MDGFQFEKVKIGSFSKVIEQDGLVMNFKVFITNNSMPLIYIQLFNEKRSKIVCVQLSNPPKYFSDKEFSDKLTDKEAEVFDYFLRTPYKYAQVFTMGAKKFDVKTYWDYVIYQCALENDMPIDNMNLKINKKGFVIFPNQPNYSRLNH